MATPSLSSSHNAGCPIVASDVGLYVSNDGGGTWAQNANILATGTSERIDQSIPVSGAVAEVWQDRGLRSALIQRGLVRARQFGWDRIVPAILEAYARAARSG